MVDEPEFEARNRDAMIPIARDMEVRDMFMKAGVDVRQNTERSEFARDWQWVSSKVRSEEKRKTFKGGLTVALFVAILSASIGTIVAPTIVPFLQRLFTSK